MSVPLPFGIVPKKYVSESTLLWAEAVPAAVKSIAVAIARFLIKNDVFILMNNLRNKKGFRPTAGETASIKAHCPLRKYEAK